MLTAIHHIFSKTKDLYTKTARSYCGQQTTSQLYKTISSRAKDKDKLFNTYVPAVSQAEAYQSTQNLYHHAQINIASHLAISQSSNCINRVSSLSPFSHTDQPSLFHQQWNPSPTSTPSSTPPPQPPPQISAPRIAAPP